MKLRTLGELCLEGSDFRQSRPLLLLAYLCLEGAQDRRHLAELFWPTSKNALSNLTTVLSRLNKLDNSLVKVEGQKLHSSLSCDATELLDSFEQENYLKITEHHQARFLNGFYLKGIGEELEEWLYATRENLANKVRYARIVQAEQKARHGMLGEAAKDAAQIYSQAGTTDLTESDLERIYRLLLAGGSQLAQTVKKEAESYGLSLNDTQEEIQQYFASKEVTQQTLENKTEVAKPHNLPAQLNSFIGREQELQELQEQLSQKDTRLVTLLGTGGMGKTRLSLKLAEELYAKNLFTDGVYFVRLASLNSHELVPQSVADALSLTIAGPQPIEEQIINQIKDLELFVVLDNFEHVLGSTPFIMKLLESSPHLTLLVTSRERLQIPAEWVYNLWGLSKAEEETDLKPFKDAIRLFEQRARQLNPSFSLDDDYEHVVEICKSVEGMPLGIELAASWANTISTRDIALELKDNASVLEANSKQFPERQRTLANVMNYAWQNLSSEEQSIFKKLSVFRGGFDYAAAKQVASATLKGLAELSNKSLIHLNNGRYEIHELLKQYAFTQLSQDNDALKSSEEKHAHYYADMMSSPEANLRNENQLNAVKMISQNLDNVLASWDWAIEQKNATIIDEIVPNFHFYCDSQSSFQLAELSFNRALPRYRAWIVESQETSLKIGFAVLLGRLITVCIRQAKHNQADTYTQEHNQYIDLLEEYNPLEHTYITISIGRVHAVFNRTELAIRHFEKTLHRAQKLQDDWLLGLAFLSLAQHSGAGLQFKKMQTYAQKSHDAFDRCGDQRVKSYSLFRLSKSCLGLGKYKEAKMYLLSSLQIRESINDVYGIIWSCSDLGKVETMLGNYESALKHLQRSYKLALQFQVQSFLSVLCQTAFGNLYLKQGKLEEAKAWIQESLNSCRTSGVNEIIAINLNILANLSLIKKEIDQANKYAQESLKISDNIGDLVQKAQSLAHLAKIELLKNPKETQTAKEYYQQALELTQTMGAAPLALEILVDWSTLEDAHQAIAYISLAKHDSRSEFAVKEKAGQRLNELQVSEGFDEAVERGKKLELWDVVASLV